MARAVCTRTTLGFMLKPRIISVCVQSAADDDDDDDDAHVKVLSIFDTDEFGEFFTKYYQICEILCLIMFIIAFNETYKWKERLNLLRLLRI